MTFSMTKLTESAIAMPFRLDSQGNIAKTKAAETLWADRVFGAIGTLQGQRLMRTTYGTKIAQTSMDTVDSMVESVENEIIRIFEAEFPTLRLTDVIVNFKEDINVLDIEVLYVLPDQRDSSTKVGIAYTDKQALIYEVNL